ncbi:MAG TPA: hypothetical protein VIV60_04245 [Polyangiaceae bacterium]
MIQNRWLFLVGLGMCAACSACSVYVDSNRVQCRTDSDCAARGAAFTGSTCQYSLCQPMVDPTWACLDDPAPAESASTTVHVIMTVVDLLSQRPISGLTLTLCAKLDASCSYSIAKFQSSDAGQLDVEMPAGFDGYLQAEGAGIYPTLIFPPNTSRQRASTTLPIVPASFFGNMFRDIGVSRVADDRSVILTTALDCLGRPAPGMILASPQTDENTVPYALQAGLPSRTTSTTDSSGAGGFVNIKAGSAVITSTIADSNRLAGTVAVQTRPGYLSMVLVLPTGG